VVLCIQDDNTQTANVHVIIVRGLPHKHGMMLTDFKR
jgi:hypothetical protein